MCCYSIDRFDSFNNITEKWINEVRHYCGEIPIVLVGLKSDLRLNVSTKGCCVPISLPKRLEEDGLVDIYIECSAKDGTNIDNCFEKAAMLVQKRKLQTRKKKCLVM
jgi:Ras family protein A